MYCFTLVLSSLRHFTSSCVLCLAAGIGELNFLIMHHAVVSCGRKIFNVNTSVIAAECLMMFGVCDVAEAVAPRSDRFVKRFVLNSSVVCEIYAICS